MKKKLQEGTQNNFLENLKQAVESGDASKGVDSINKINEIHKLASTMDGNDAKQLNLRAKERMLKLEEEDHKLRLVANIENGETELKELNKEFKDVSKQYLEIIEKQEELIEEMKNKFNEKYNKDGEEEKKRKENGEG